MTVVESRRVEAGEERTLGHMERVRVGEERLDKIAPISLVSTGIHWDANSKWGSKYMKVMTG